MSDRQIIIYGAGGFAREVAWLAYSCKPMYEVAAFVDDNSTLYGSILNGIPVLSIEDARQQFPQSKIVCGIGSPHTREMLMRRSSLLGYKFATLIHPRVEHSKWIDIGLGTIICTGNILTVNIKIGMHVHLNLGCTIGHDVVIEDYATLSPGVHVSGHVHIGRRVYIGTGAVIINGTQDEDITIGDDSIIGAGACVTKSILPGTTVVGVPAKPIHQL